MIDISDDDYLLFKSYLLDNWGIDIPLDKKYLFYTRLNNFFHSGEYKTFSELYNHLKKADEPKLKNRIIELMTTNETSFFRDNHPFEALQNHILPEFYKRHSEQKITFPFNIKIWSAGCSTGQEAYSIAMTLKEWSSFKKDILPGNLKIISTDISEEVLNKAKEGKYKEKDIQKGMKTEYLNKYIHTQDDSWNISTDIKKMIDFRIYNLSENFDPSYINFDIIFCRNVIIYFSNDIKKKILKQFFSALNKESYLIVGASENLYGYTDFFEPIHIGQSTIYKVKK